MTPIRKIVLLIFIISLILAAYLGFALIHLRNDKLIHFLTFFILTIEFYFIFVTNRNELKILRYITFLICTVGASVGLEIVQHIVNPSRVFDINDIICNFSGSLIGLGVSSGYLIWAVKNKRPKKQSYGMVNRQSRAVTVNEDMLPDEEEYVRIELKDAAEQV